MRDAEKIVTPEGLTLAQIISQTREQFQAAELKRDDIAIYNKYLKQLEITFLRVN